MALIQLMVHYQRLVLLCSAPSLHLCMLLFHPKCSTRHWSLLNFLLLINCCQWIQGNSCGTGPGKQYQEVIGGVAAGSRDPHPSAGGQKGTCARPKTQFQHAWDGARSKGTQCWLKGMVGARPLPTTNPATQGQEGQCQAPGSQSWLMGELGGTRTNPGVWGQEVEGMMPGPQGPIPIHRDSTRSLEINLHVWVQKRLLWSKPSAPQEVRGGGARPLDPNLGMHRSLGCT